MKPNLAAAVELIISLMRTDARNADGANSTAGKIISANLNYYADKLDPILAELGRGAGGEVAATLIHSPDELTRVDISMHGMGLGYGKHDLFAHPPVAGLAELTDAPVGSLRFIAKRNLKSLIELCVKDDHDKKTMLSCLEELS